VKTFEQFRRELADAVTVAINSGRRIGKDNRAGGCCPLGVRTDSPFPGGFSAEAAWDIHPGEAWEFADGFDGDATGDRGDSPFFKLGRLYRQRFVEGKVKLYRVTYSGEAYVLADSPEDAVRVISRNVYDATGLGLDMDPSEPLDSIEDVDDWAWRDVEPYAQRFEPEFADKTIRQILEGK
jgi:hypothetical protein